MKKWIPILLFLIAGNAHADIIFSGVTMKGIKLKGIPPLDPLSMTITPGLEFVATSYIYTPLADNAAIDTMSAVYVSTLLAQRTNNFGVAKVNVRAFTPAIYIVSSTQPTVQVRQWDRDNPTSNYSQVLQDKWQNVPLPSTFTAATGTDQEAIVYVRDTGVYYEFWKFQQTTSTVLSSTGGLVLQWGARWGGRIDNISKNPGMFETEGGTGWSGQGGTKMGTTATSLPFLAGLITIQEFNAGVINHALSFMVVDAALFTRWNYPASRSDGTVKISSGIPEGITIRFPYDLDLSTFGIKPIGLMIAKAVQKYGAILNDRSGGIGFRAENPGNKYLGANNDPYLKPGGIQGCVVDGVQSDENYLDDHIYTNPDSSVGGLLYNFPWDKIVFLSGTSNQP